MDAIFTVVEQEKKILILLDSFALALNDAGCCALVSRGLSLPAAIKKKRRIELFIKNYNRTGKKE